MKNKAIIVLGMHRSGTSALSGALSILGVSMGSELLMGSPDDNSKGLFEHAGIVDVHNRLLKSMGASWDTVFPLPSGWSETETVKPFRDELTTIIEKDFAATPLWGLKDPRMCRLLPLWLPLLEKLGHEPHLIIVFRDPSEVVKSHAKRDLFPQFKSYLLWLDHVLKAEQNSRDSKRMFMNYVRLLSDWKGAMESIGSGLGVEWLRSPGDVESEMNGFITESMRHQRMSDEDRKPPLVEKVYALLQRASEGENTNDGFDKVNVVFDETSRLCGEFYQSSLDELTAFKEEAEAQIDFNIEKANRMTLAMNEVAQTTMDLAQKEETVFSNLKQMLDLQIRLKKLSDKVKRAT